jgi:uncharacterized protein YqjF (DUF2071 family)
MNRKPALFLTANWRFLVMLNYLADSDTVSALKKLTPPGTELDSWNGKTLVSMVGFLFLDIRLLKIPVPFHRNFEEVNLRFYVRRKCGTEWRRGVVFVREIVPLPAVAAIARLCYGEKYVATRMRHQIVSPSSGDSATLHLGRAEYHWFHQGRFCSLSAQFSGTPTFPEPGSEEEFITEHYWGYSARPNGPCTEYEVEHPRWRVWSALDPQLECDPKTLYGPSFHHTLSAPPSSAFVAEGSPVAVRWGTRITR